MNVIKKIFFPIVSCILLFQSKGIAGNYTVSTTIEITAAAINRYLNTEYDSWEIPQYESVTFNGVNYELTLCLPQIILTPGNAKLQMEFDVYAGAAHLYHFIVDPSVDIPSGQITLSQVQAFLTNLPALLDSVQQIPQWVRDTLTHYYNSIGITMYPSKLIDTVNTNWLAQRSINVVPPYFALGWQVGSGVIDLTVSTYLDGEIPYFSAYLSYDSGLHLLWRKDVTIDSDYTIPAGETVTIVPGTHVKLASGVTLTIDGTLDAESPSYNYAIRFEEATPGSPWNAIQVNGGNCKFSRCYFNGGTNDVVLDRNSGNSFDDCTFANASGDGLDIGGAGVSIDSCTFEDNQEGIYMFGSANASVTHSTISNNSGVGLYLETGTISDFTNNAVENNGQYGIEIEGGTLYMGNGTGTYGIGTNPNSPNPNPTAGAGDNNITGNCTSSGNAELYVDTNGRLYVGSVGGNSSGYTLQDGFNSITTGTYYIYNAAMTVIDETEEQWTVPAEETYWGGHGVGSENFYGTVDFSYPLTSDPSGGAGASALEVVTTAGTNNKPATLMTAAMAANVFKSAPDASQGQFFVNLKNRMMQVINDINNPKMALTHPRMIGYLNSLCSFDTNNVTGERGAVQDMLTSYYKELPAGNFSDTTSRLCSEAALVAEVQNEVNSGQLDSAETLMNEYGKYVKNNDNQRTLLFNQMEIDQQRKQDGEALGVLKQIEAFQPDSKQKRNYEVPNYAALASLVGQGSAGSGQSQNERQALDETIAVPTKFALL